jgi:hypothetical protein
MSLNTHYQALINRGRKAGLTTRELYSAPSREATTCSAVPTVMVTCPASVRKGNASTARLAAAGGPENVRERDS